MKRRMHGAAGVAAFAVIVAFFASTVAVELFGGPSAVAMVKRSVLYGLVLLVPAMVAAGGTGMSLAAGCAAGAEGRKKRRMPVIGINGVAVLIPSAVVLDRIASAAVVSGGGLGVAFYAVQAVELAAGGLNITLMFLNIRDGFGIRRRSRPPRFSCSGSSRSGGTRP